MRPAAWLAQAFPTVASAGQQVAWALELADIIAEEGDEEGIQPLVRRR